MKKMLFLLIIVMVGQQNFAANDTIYRFNPNKHCIEATIVSEQVTRSVSTGNVNLSTLSNAELGVLMKTGFVNANAKQMYFPTKILGDTRIAIFTSLDQFVIHKGKIYMNSIWDVSKDERKYAIGFILMLAPTFLILFPWFFRKRYGEDIDKRKWLTIFFSIAVIFTATLIIPQGMLAYPLLSGGQEQLGLINGVFAMLVILIAAFHWLPGNSVLPILGGLCLPGLVIIMSSALVTKALIIMQGSTLTGKKIIISSEFVIIWEYLLMLLCVTVISYTVQKLVLRYRRHHPLQ